MSLGLKLLVRDRPALRAGALRIGAMLRGMACASPGLYTLLYHRVPAAAQDQFDKQLQILKRYSTFVSADDAVERVRQGWRGTDRAFLLTFDDGQADNIDVALPVLRRHRVPAIQFLVSDWVDRPPSRSGRTDGFMRRDDVKAWLDAGLSIGSHTASHPRLSRLDAGQVRAEFRRSREALGELAGAPIAHFACPWGKSDVDFDAERDPALARACGYATFFTTRRGYATRPEDLFAMPRHVLEPHWSTPMLQALLGGWKHARG